MGTLEYAKSTKLDTLAKIFNLPTSKDEMDGSMVYDYFLEGRLEDICRYCMKDVELTRLVYYKMAYDDINPTADFSDIAAEHDQEQA